MTKIIRTEFKYVEIGQSFQRTIKHQTEMIWEKTSATTAEAEFHTIEIVESEIVDVWAKSQTEINEIVDGLKREIETLTYRAENAEYQKMMSEIENSK